MEKVIEKNCSISIIRFLSMCSIVCCHIMQSLNNELAWWFNVGVQVFLCISGWLYSKKDLKPAAFYKKSFIKILSGYYIVLLFFALIGLLIIRSITFKEFSGALISFDLIPGGEHLWFIPTILLCYLMVPLLQMIFSGCGDKKCSIRVAVLLIAVLILLRKFTDFNPARVSCFIIGYYLGKLNKTTVVNWVIISLMLLFNTLKIVSKYIVKLDIPDFFMFSEYSHLLLGVSLFLILKYCFKNAKSNPLLELSDKYSYYVYLVHQFWILGPLSLMNFTGFLIIDILIIICVTIALAVVFRSIVEHITSFIKKQI